MKEQRDQVGPAAETIVRMVTEKYLSSEFNGLPAHDLIQALAESRELLQATVVALLKDGQLTAEFGDRHPNPHVMALPSEDVDSMVQKIEAGHDFCLYPTPAVLEKAVDIAEYEGRPYSLMLALGRPQLEHISFRLEVLDIYRWDPRFHYETSDVGGWIHVKPEHLESLPKTGQAHINSYGFAYDEDMGRAVAVFLWDLHTLIPEQQRLWKTFQLDGSYKLHPGFFDTQVLGKWPEKVSIFAAFLEELVHINAMSRLMGRPPLFRDIPEERPRTFCFLLRPTLKEFEAFVHLLDKLMSDNINRSFFGTDVALFRLEERKDGTRVEVPKGTIQLLEEWLSTRFKAKAPEPLKQIFKAFRDVRSRRKSLHTPSWRTSSILPSSRNREN
jgi:hypothetical protein